MFTYVRLGREILRRVSMAGGEGGGPDTVKNIAAMTKIIIIILFWW